MGTVREFRISLEKNKNKKNRMVAPFSQQSLQQHTKVIPPPRLNTLDVRPVKQTLFRKYFKRGDIPIERKKNGKLNEPIDWVVPLNKLDYSIYLPLLFDGLAESALPYKLFARCGLHDMLVAGGDKVLPVVPQLIFPIKRALDTRDADIVIATLTAIQQLIKTAPSVGKALVPYYRQILPIFNLMRDVNVNLNDKIDFNRIGYVGDKIEETLQLLEKTGGSRAYLNIKYMVPTYQSIFRK